MGEVERVAMVPRPGCKARAIGSGLGPHPQRQPLPGVDAIVHGNSVVAVVVDGILHRAGEGDEPALLVDDLRVEPPSSTPSE